MKIKLPKSFADAIQTIGSEIDHSSPELQQTMIAALTTLIAYSQRRNIACQRRLEGNIEVATNWERTADKYYSELPSECHW